MILESQWIQEIFYRKEQAFYDGYISLSIFKKGTIFHSHLTRYTTTHTQCSLRTHILYICNSCCSIVLCELVFCIVKILYVIITANGENNNMQQSVTRKYELQH